jgi:hypothetical protein
MDEVEDAGTDVYRGGTSSWLPVVVPIIRHESRGHIGLFRCLLQHLLATFPDVAVMHTRDNNAATKDIVLNYYFGSMMNAWITQRFFHWQIPTYHRRVATDILQRMLTGEQIYVPIFSPPDFPSSSSSSSDSETSSSSIAAAADSSSSSSSGGESERNVVLRLLLRVAVLINVNGVVEFATPLHRRFYLRQIYPSAIEEKQFSAAVSENDNNDGNRIEKWILMVLSTFEPDRLKHSESDFPKEGMLQHQFWRGACMCLPARHRIAAEVSNLTSFGRQTRGGGEVDFWINSELQWACELLRLGDRKGAHLARFFETGIYSSLKPKLWRVFDFRRHDVHPIAEDYYVAVILSRDFLSAKVQFGKNSTTIPVKFEGMLRLDVSNGKAGDEG